MVGKKLYYVRLQCLNVIAGGLDELSFAYVYVDDEEEAKRLTMDGMCFPIDAIELGER
jgi:phage head maturation protease